VDGCKPLPSTCSTAAAVRLVPVSRFSFARNSTHARRRAARSMAAAAGAGAGRGYVVEGAAAAARCCELCFREGHERRKQIAAHGA